MTAEARVIMMFSAFFGALSLLALYFGNVGAIIVCNLIVLGLSGYGAYKA
ncbi:hypothetical protein ACC699_13640 [Rhizobium ruizarguesonis]